MHIMFIFYRNLKIYQLHLIIAFIVTILYFKRFSFITNVKITMCKMMCNMLNHLKQIPQNTNGHYKPKDTHTHTK